jgi:hypothetical protein
MVRNAQQNLNHYTVAGHLARQLRWFGPKQAVSLACGPVNDSTIITTIKYYENAELVRNGRSGGGIVPGSE